MSGNFGDFIKNCSSFFTKENREVMVEYFKDQIKYYQKQLNFLKDDSELAPNKQPINIEDKNMAHIAFQDLEKVKEALNTPSPLFDKAKELTLDEARVVADLHTAAADQAKATLQALEEAAAKAAEEAAAKAAEEAAAKAAEEAAAKEAEEAAKAPEAPVENTPEAPVVENEQVDPVVENTPEAPVVENEQVDPVVENTPEAPGVENTPEAPGVENTPDAPVVENTPEAPVDLSGQDNTLGGEF